ncbi:HAD-superfamily hydrolase [Annulohypoxylon moriforme]|nr:HAD-superfamily hydrolase [Annulohypoxylon moriforme]
MAPVKERSVAFAFDVDGVLVKGKKPLPGASEAIGLLQRKNVPFMFLTNGGGHTEEAHVKKVGQRLGLTFSPKQFVQSHTPYFDLVPEYGDKIVLVLGGHGQQIRGVAHAYGFKNVVTSSDIVATCKHIHAFPEITRDHHDEHGSEHPELRTTPISAILCWSSPRDWYLDLQVVQDLLLSSGGMLGTVSPKNGDVSLLNKGYLQDGQPKLFFCNPDFEWCTEHEQPRLAQGAFKEALEAIWKAKTGTDLEYTRFGKPTEATYEYAERILREYGKSLDPSREIGTVYMIGDNPESDIAGANTFRSRYGIEWRSVLVETGVHIAGSVPKHKPYHTVRNVMEAVEWALEKGAAVLN